MRMLLFGTNLLCFASFGWAMARHFEPGGKPKPGMLLTALAVPVFAAAQLWATLALPAPGAAPAMVLYVAAAALFWSAIRVTRGRRLGACFQQQEPSGIVTAGPYRYVRHPFYLSYSLVWAGGFVATRWAPLALVAIFMAVLYYRAARQEERTLLSSSHADVYRAYLRQTGRLQ